MTRRPSLAGVGWSETVASSEPSDECPPLRASEAAVKPVSQVKFVPQESERLMNGLSSPLFDSTRRGRWTWCGALVQINKEKLIGSILDGIVPC